MFKPQRSILNIIGAVILVVVSAPVFAEMSPAEREQLQQLQREVEVLKRQVNELVRKGGAGSREAAPAPRVNIQRPRISLGTIPTLGNEEAKVALIEFSDYQCPYCRRFHKQTFDRLKKKYIDSGKVLYAYRDLPSPARPQALKAAVAARCAGEQGKYFQMQKMLFDDGPRLVEGSYAKYAERLGLNIRKFNTCLADQKQVDLIDQDVYDGRRLGIRGTPTFYIGTLKNGEVIDSNQIVGALPYTMFKRALEKALQ